MNGILRKTVFRWGEDKMEHVGADDQFLQFEVPDLLNGLHPRFLGTWKISVNEAVMLQVVGGS